MIKKKKKSESFVWTSYSDLMTGMMMCFVLILLYSMSRNDANNPDMKTLENVRSSKGKVNSDFREIVKEINERFSYDCSGAKFEIPNKNVLAIRITFQDNRSWFEEGGFVLSSSGEKCLSKFAPVILRKLYNSNKKNSIKISQIVVEGHTNSNPIIGGGDPFLDNLDLSQKRSLEAVKFILSNTKNTSFAEDEEFNRWVKKVLSANGRSFSELIYKDENKKIEDKVSSKRIEIKANLEYEF